MNPEPAGVKMSPCVPIRNEPTNTEGKGEQPTIPSLRSSAGLHCSPPSHSSRNRNSGKEGSQTMEPDMDFLMSSFFLVCCTQGIPAVGRGEADPGVSFIPAGMGGHPGSPWCGNPTRGSIWVCPRGSGVILSLLRVWKRGAGTWWRDVNASGSVGNVGGEQGW